MAKHKKPAPAAKKPAPKSAPAAKKKTTPVPAKKDVPAGKKVAAKPAPKATPAPAKAPAKSSPKAPPPKAEAQRSGKTTPPLPPAKSKAPFSSKTTPPHPTAKSSPPIPAKPAPASKPAPAKPAPAAAVASTSEKPASKVKSVKTDARELLRNRILGAKKATKPIAFTLEEVREIAKTLPTTPAPAPEVAKPAKAAPTKAPVKIEAAKIEKPAAPTHVKAASLADILGFNPKKEQKATVDIDPEQVPEKFRRYYKLLLDLRGHITEGLNLHTEETLKRSAKDDADDLSSYGQHMADAGTDTFDRDFALSLVSSEQEALTEIEAAIRRIHDGSYGTCEVTGKPIAKERLMAVPFTRYSAEAQKEIEKNRMRTRTAAGLFGEHGEEGAKISDDDGGGDE